MVAKNYGIDVDVYCAEINFTAVLGLLLPERPRAGRLTSWSLIVSNDKVEIMPLPCGCCKVDSRPGVVGVFRKRITVMIVVVIIII